MPVEPYLILSAALLGIGLGAALYRRNLIAVVMGVMTSGLGALVAMAVIDNDAGNRGDGLVFAFCLGVVLTAMLVLGCAVAYRRRLSSGTVNVDDGSELRH